MGFSKLTTHFQENRVDRASRGGHKVCSIGHHHTASPSKSGSLAQFLPGGRLVTPNYFIWEDEIWGIVDEDFKAHTSASFIDDARAITYEIGNSTGGPGWKFSKKTLESVIALDADIAERYDIPLKVGLPGFWQHRNIYEWFGRGYATACAGPSFDMSKTISDVRELIAAANAQEVEDEMPARKKVTAEVETPVGREWSWLRLNTDGDVTLASGPARVDIVANIVARDLAVAAIEAPEGGVATLVSPTVVQARLVRSRVKGGKTVTRSEGVGLELVANGGSTFGQLVGLVDLEEDERLRIQAIAFSDVPVDVTFSASLRVQKL